ncbi:hypothetical protein [Flavobacterium akiainvivens]|nr:hypothetical protein [Flavobacterium akiainvivens]SFQ43770.1 hypothetical protein SAMN05444144_104283 [Flavobacterium akiainvivens]
MKKIVLLAAFSLLGGSLVSCDNEKTGSDGYAYEYNTDDGFVPPVRPPRP